MAALDHGTAWLCRRWNGDWCIHRDVDKREVDTNLAVHELPVIFRQLPIKLLPNDAFPWRWQSPRPI